MAASLSLDPSTQAAVDVGVRQALVAITRAAADPSGEFEKLLIFDDQALNLGLKGACKAHRRLKRDRTWPV